jgi:hypothetical protein
MALPAAGADRNKPIRTGCTHPKGTKLEMELQRAGQAVAPAIAGEGALSVWVGLRASDHEMFRESMPVSYVISMDDDPPGQIPYLSVEAATRHHGCWSNDELETVVGAASFRPFLETLSDPARPVNILCYHSLPELEWFAASHSHIRVLASPFSLKRRFDDKFGFPSLLDAAGLPSIPSLVIPCSACDYKTLARELGPSLVGRLRIGASGNATFRIRSAQDLFSLRLRFGDEPVALSPYLPGPSFNINGFIGKKVHLAPPSIQLIGEEPLATTPFAYCGNDFAAMSSLPEWLTRNILDTSKRLGDELQKAGYHGVFGVDLLYHEQSKTLYALEVNPRFQGSTPTLCRYHLSHGQQTLVHSFHAEPSQSQQLEPVNASMMLLHNRSNAPQTITTHIPSGLYRYRWEKGGFRLLPLAGDSAFPTQADQVLVRGCPQLGTTVSPQATLFRIEVLGSVLNPATLRLDANSNRLVRAMELLAWQKAPACAA